MQFPAGNIEVSQLVLNDFPDRIALRGMGRSITTLHFQPSPGEWGFQITYAGEGTKTFLTAGASGADTRLRVYDATGFSSNSVVKLIDYSTDMAGNGSWPYDPRPNLHNGEFLRIEQSKPISAMLHLVTPVQSSVEYEVHKTSLAEDVVEGALQLPVISAEEFYTGSSIVLLPVGSAPVLATVTGVGDDSILLSEPVPQEMNAGTEVFTHVQVELVDAIHGLHLADFSVRFNGVDARGMLVSNVQDFLIERIAIYGGSWAGIRLDNCLDGDISQFLIAEGDQTRETGSGYGLQTYGCQAVNIHDGIIREHRRAIDLSGLHPSRLVRVYDNLLEGSSRIAGSTVAGIHGTAEHCDFSNNLLVGGRNGGLILRGNFITVHGNRFVGTHLAAIVIADGAYVTVSNNTVEGMKRWNVDSGGRWVGQFIRLRSQRAVQLISRGNTTFLESAHIRVENNVANARVWVMDDIVFRSGAPGEQAIVDIQAGSQIRLSLNSNAVNYDSLIIGEGDVFPEWDQVIWPSEQ
ncbi:hypothetical protein A9Q02_11135 [Candidatus Chloroploca asiatica]|uniref:Right handed beta helix domain-containing protein n=1 Tax=Candidatus Chloroploca asiatica TaxID=1506545 RepID=A0A2H3KX44_9CHLR|nr:hypothetical protein A9Q02_11135 [Candidatus Chloroploca asiatica]